MRLVNSVVLAAFALMAFGMALWYKRQRDEAIRTSHNLLAQTLWQGEKEAIS